MAEIVHPNSSSAGLTCHTAPGIVFASEEELKAHYRSEWHRHNLKRKVANLQPITKADYESRLAALKKSQEASAAGKKLREKANKKAVPDDSRKKHPQSKAAAGERRSQMTEEEFIEDKLRNALQYDPSMSLFDKHKSQTIEQNLQYMEKKFGFFVPYMDFVTDVPGLLCYLGEKIYVGNYALASSKQFHSLEAVQQHMVQKGQCFMNLDQIDEYAPFYDIARLARTGRLVLEEDDSDGSDSDGWETDSADDDGAAGPSDPQQSGKGKSYLLASWRTQHRVAEADRGFHLQLGRKRAGHRQLRIYYRQQPRPQDQRQSLAAATRNARLRIAIGGRTYLIQDTKTGQHLRATVSDATDHLTRRTQKAALDLFWRKNLKRQWRPKLANIVGNSGR